MVDLLELIFSKTNHLIGAITTIVGFFAIEAIIIPKRYRINIAKKINPLRKKRLSLGQVITKSFNFFETWFGKKHVSLQCILVSATFTLFFTIMGFLLIAVFFSKYDFNNMLSIVSYKENHKFIIFAIFANIFIDYISLAETRFIINRIRNETSKIGILVYLIADALITFLIFVILFSLFKTVVDFILILPEYYSSEELIINHGASTSVLINSENGYFNSFIDYWISVIKYSFISSWQLLEHGFREYWFSSLFLPTTNNSYTIHTSTIWLTTHFSSFYIYLVLVLWLLVRLPVNNLKIPWFSTTLNNSEYPITVIMINLFLGLLILLFIGYVYNYSGWLGVFIVLTFTYLIFRKINSFSLEKVKASQKP